MTAPDSAIEAQHIGRRAVWAAALLGWLLVGLLSVGFLRHWHRRERQVMEDQAFSLVHALANALRTMGGPVARAEVAVQDVFDQIVATPSISGIALLTAEDAVSSGLGVPMERLAAVDEAPKGALFLEHDIVVWDTVNVGACARPAPGRYGGRRGRGGEATTPARREGVSKARLFVSLPLLTLHARWRRDTLVVSLFCGVTLAASIALVRLWGLSRRSLADAARLRLAAEETRALQEMNLVAAGLAHEIKNPLSVVRGTAQHLAEHRDDAQEAALAADAIVQEIDRVSSRINELLLFAKPRAPLLAAVSIPELCAELAVLLTDELADAGLTLRAPAVCPAVWADREQLRQVLLNLLHNALRFAPHSGVVDVQVQPSAAGSVTLTVCDAGPGVPEADREAVFAPYYTTSPEGSGLGLAIVRRICRAHGWRVTCLKRAGGAAFEISGLAAVGSGAAPAARGPA
jgi:signal transduction histidine kinase